MDAGVGQIVHVQELAHGGAAAPDDVFIVTAQLGLVRLAHQCGQHVAVGEVVVVVRAVEVGGHGAHVLAAVLVVVGLGELDAGDLGDGIRLVGRLQRAGEQVVLADRLRAVARVDAAGAQEHQALHTGEVGAVDQVGLDQQVLIEEVGAVEVVGVDAPDLGCGDEEVVGPFLLQEGQHRALVQQVQLRTAAGDDLGVAAGLQAAHQRAADHATVPGHEDLGVRGDSVHWRCGLMRSCLGTGMHSN